MEGSIMWSQVLLLLLLLLVVVLILHAFLFAKDKHLFKKIYIYTYISIKNNKKRILQFIKIIYLNI